MKLKHLRGRKTNDYLRRRGNVWKGKTMTIRHLPGAPKSTVIDPSKLAIYAGTAASTKLHKSAVKRNRMRRRCREAFRREVENHEKLPIMQLLISPKASSLDCEFGDIQADVVAFLSSVS